MEGRTLTAQPPILLPVQARVFEAIASTGWLAGPVHDLARQFGVTPIAFMDCLGELVDVGWVTITADPESVFTIRLDRDARART